LANGAISAIRTQDDPAYLGPLQETLARREADFTSYGMAQGLSTLGYLARNEEKKDGVEGFLAGYVNHKKQNLRLAAIRALGTLSDPKAIAMLETFANASKKSPEQKAAEQAVADLRAGRKPVDDFKNLRQEMTDLEKQSRDLRKDLDDLKKQVEAQKTAGKGPPAKPKVLAPKDR